MKKAGAIAKRYGVHPDTIRVWTDTFQEFFSDGARRGAGIRRAYTPDDELALNTIHELRRQNVEYEEIRARLTNGERIEILPAVNEPVPETAVEIYGRLKSLERLLEDKDKQIADLKAQMKADSEMDRQEIIRLNSEIAVLKYQLDLIA